MLAVIKTGGKQYIVEPGKTIEIEKLEGEPGSGVDFSEVLLVSDGETTRVGTPFAEGAKVTGKIVDQIKGDKVIVFKYKAKKRYRKKTGHRQQYTRVRIESVA